MEEIGDNSGEASLTFKFKKPSRKPMRKRLEIEEDDDAGGSDELDVLLKLEETKELQKLRERPHGISAVALAIGKRITVEEEVTVNDPFKVTTGGMADMKAVKAGKQNSSSADDAYETGIGTQFSVETNTRDEDAEMMKYIEEQLAKRKGLMQEDEDKSNKYLTPEEIAFSSVPEYLRVKSSVQSEEMLSNQMLSGIPEVDLGIEAKIKNIEATEEAKQKLLQERLRKKDGPSMFVPTNMAVNFVQHNRFNIEESGPPRKKRAEASVKPAVPVELPKRLDNVGGKKEHDKASDDFYFEKFRRQFRR
ncbi:telomere length and silencing protein 1 homolog [Daphnia pulex]|uniref:EOG090X0F7F n=1 Tax=Daphnia pulex TaxID=6669 RepID=A0A4Y7MV68_DAPPU|nr:telomere length and silencing protein 1 homolog [Daphnia pulex]SVE84555.1 EOG090X0F7F [Daphnia pulex]